MKVRIQAIDASKKPVFDFFGPTITIGRDTGCDLPMPGTTNVSGRHAQITLAPDGASLIDLESTNGTYLNDRRIEGRKKLRKGDFFRLGQTGPCFQIVELDLTGAAPARVVVGTEREKVTGIEEEPVYSAPAPRAPIAKAKPMPAPQAPEPASAPKPATAASGQTRLMVVQLQKTNRTLMLGVGAAVLGLVVMGGSTGLYLILKQSDLSSRTANLDDTAKKLRENTDDLKQTVGQVSTNVEKLTKGEEENIFGLYGDAVFLVALYDKSGAVIPFGTAFAVQREGRMGTNAHIALPVRDFLKKGLKVCAISPGGKKEYPVIGTVWHRDYKDWPPEQGIPYQTPDVGVLTVQMAPAESFAKIVDLASEPELRKLGPGAHLCYIGFPGWSDYGTLKKVTPHVYPGPLTRLTTLKEEVGDYSNQYLLQHDMSTTGGASGSPIFNRDGKVVAIHNSGRRTAIFDKKGNVQFVPQAGPKTAMRIDLLTELLR